MLPAFAAALSVGAPAATPVRRCVCPPPPPRGHGARSPPPRRAQPAMLVPPFKQIEPPLTPQELGPKGYTWNDDYPGTMKPGQVEDNFPLERVLASDVFEKMQYQELDMDERADEIFGPDEDLLDWLSKNNRLITKGASDEDIDMQMNASDSEQENAPFVEDDDDKMIAYYTKQGEGSSTGSSFDFGGFADSTSDFSGFM